MDDEEEKIEGLSPEAKASFLSCYDRMFSFTQNELREHGAHRDHVAMSLIMLTALFCAESLKPDEVFADVTQILQDAFNTLKEDVDQEAEQEGPASPDESPV